MTTNTTTHRLNNELTLYDPTGAPLVVQTVTMSFTQENDKVTECRLTCRVNPQIYQHIDQNALFNLQPDGRGQMTSGEKFQPEPDIEIENRLHPELLPHLMEHTTTIDEAATFLFNPDQNTADNLFRATESWLGLSVRQLQGTVKVGYDTAWLDNSQLPSPLKIQSLEEMADLVLEESGFASSSNQLNLAESKTIFEAIINFFKLDEWPVSIIENESALRMSFQGENGQFTCYAQAREAHQQFIFYSICPVKVPEGKRLVVAEFLTRANYGMVMGNFELDFRDGEIRYKTSIDVEGDRLSPSLSRHVIYPNVMMMDRYLSGIMMVTYGGLSPEQAIKQIEHE